MRIRTKFLLVFFVISFIPLLFLTLINFNFSQNAIINDVQNKLETIANLQVSRITSLINRYSSRLNRIANTQSFTDSLTGFIKENNYFAQQQLSNNLLGTLMLFDDIQTISFTDNSGKIIASSDVSLIGKMQQASDFPYLRIKKSNVKIDFLPGKGNDLLTRFSEPIYSNQKNIGNLEIITKRNIFIDIINNDSVLGKTGEIDLSIRGRSGLTFFIAPTREDNIEGYVPSHFMPSIPSNIALMKKNSFVANTTDYRGKSVAAVTRYLPDLGLGLVVKIDRDEAFQSISGLKDVVLISSFIFMILIIFVVLFLVNSLTGPIAHLAFVAKQITIGNYSARALSLSNDEIGETSAVFNSMLDTLQSLLSDLEKKVQDRTAALEEANKELESFSYSVSHDLRAPLRAIDGFSKILVEDYADKFDDDGKKLIETIRNSTSQMGKLIDDLLAFSRLGRQEVKKENVNMTTLVKNVFEELKSLNPNRKIEFNSTELPTAFADSALIRQVWTNLLSNAIKYTKKKETAVIMVGSEVKNGENVYFVKDNGAGFDMKYVDKLFGVFQRLHSAQEFEGTGVGLALVARIIKKHGGKTWAEGIVDNGATFYFSLPTGVAYS